MPEFHSKFGGLWIDQTDAARVQQRLRGIESLQLRSLMASFIQGGFIVLRNAVSHGVIDAYLAEYEAAADSGGILEVEVPREGGRQPFTRAHASKPGSKVLDTGMLLSHGRELCFAPKLTDFLTALFAARSLAFQTLHFEVGSTQAIHQDTSYVVVDGAPLELAASWIALEDVKPGSGELIYYPGGHRMAEHAFAGGESKHWDPERHGPAEHDFHLRYLTTEALRLGLAQAHFLPRKGDALIWHADLPHGGGAITQPVTRRSFVTHYCPLTRQPHYLNFSPPERRHKTPIGTGDAFCSLYFPPEKFARLPQRW
jgi:hypothetical protein